MRSILTIVTPAYDLALLTIEEMRSAAGVTGSAHDAELEALGVRISAAVTSECRVAIGRGAPPTLRRERCEERFTRLSGAPVFLSRRHDIEIVTVMLDDVAIAETDFDVEPEGGEFVRIADGSPFGWAGRGLVVTYDAGFADVPADLKMAAFDFFRLAWQERTRDPALKALEEDVPGVLRTRKEFWVGAVPGLAGETAVPAVVSGQLLRFMNTVVA